MSMKLIQGLTICVAVVAAQLSPLTLAQAAPFSVFSCKLRAGGGHQGNLNFYAYTYSGFKWVECSVEAPEVQIDSIKLNHGNCGVLDNWFIDRTFKAGETINISYDCLSPVVLEITANNRTSIIPLK